MKEILSLATVETADLSATIELIADRLLRDVPPDDSDDETRQQVLLERALIYAARIERQLADQIQRIAYLQDLSRTDDLTGLLNRRGFMDQFRRALAFSRRYGHEGLLLYCDLDSFKSVNDAYGHAAGDALLQLTGKTLLDAVRDCDVVGRLGGDEFAVVLVQTSWRDGLKRAQTIQWRLEQTTLDFDDQAIPLRVSIGYEAYGPEDAIDDLICRADMAMYYFKRRKQAPIARVAAE
ncbi:MAG: GGDEF domain-containing protein [Alphaproteobacteria bacterium]